LPRNGLPRIFLPSFTDMFRVFARRHHQHTERVLPNVKSAEKRVRTNEKRRERNRRDRSRMRTAIKKVRQADSAQTARDALVRAESLLDRMAGKGVIHGNTAARQKSRLHAHVKRLEA
jgi:small subunit ribosomal protein S20